MQLSVSVSELAHTHTLSLTALPSVWLLFSLDQVVVVLGISRLAVVVVVVTVRRR